MKVTCENLKNYLKNHAEIDVWLGGTCGSENSWDWRKELIAKLPECVSYYDPFLRPWETDEEWDAKHQEMEVIAKASSTMHVYVLTSDMAGCFSIAEITDAIYRNGYENICVAIIDYKNSFPINTKKSLNACAALWKSLGVTILDTIDEVSSWIVSVNHDGIFKKE